MCLNYAQPMRKFNILIFFAIASLTACKEEEYITQIYPTDNSTVNPCCVNFQWESNIDGKCRLIVSDTSSYSNLIIDSMVSTQEFLYSNSLKPGVKYYWRLRSGRLDERSSFMVKDVVGDYVGGQRLVNVYRYDWRMDITGTYGDTSFTAALKVSKGYYADVVVEVDNVVGRADFYEGEPFGFLTIPPENQTIYFSKGAGTSSCYIAFDYVNDSIHISISAGGLGGGRIWRIWGRK